MVNLRKRQIKGTILLEALLALGVFAVIASLLLGQITQSRKEAAVISENKGSDSSVPSGRGVD